MKNSVTISIFIIFFFGLNSFTFKNNLKVKKKSEIKLALANKRSLSDVPISQPSIKKQKNSIAISDSEQPKTDSDFEIPEIKLPPISPYATVYYVSASTGSDGNLGTSKSSPLASINKALQFAKGGDVVYVMSGTYNESLAINKSGTSRGYTTIMRMPGSESRPKIVLNPSKDSNQASVIDIRAAYVFVSGFNITQNGDTPVRKTYASGIGVHGKVAGSYLGLQTLVHHIFLYDNVIHDNAASGISVAHSDYITIYKNVVYGNAKLAPNQTSGISLWGLYNFDQAIGYHNLIVSNKSYGNVVLTNANYKTPDGTIHQNNCTTDGNGIIIDDSRRTQQVDKVPYRSATLIFNNLIYNNGGRGIAIYLSDNVNVINNTLYHNMKSSMMCSPTQQGDLVAANAGNVKFINNIVQSGGIANAIVERNVTGEHFFKNNLVSGKLLIDKRNGADLSFENTNFIGINPNFKHPVEDFSNDANFELNERSPALNRGQQIKKTITTLSRGKISTSITTNLGATFGDQ